MYETAWRKASLAEIASVLLLSEHYIWMCNYFECLFLLIFTFILSPQSTKASDDLLQLSANPFADMFSAPPQAPSVPVAAAVSDMWLSNGK